MTPRQGRPRRPAAGDRRQQRPQNGGDSRPEASDRRQQSGTAPGARRQQRSGTGSGWGQQRAAAPYERREPRRTLPRWELTVLPGLAEIAMREAVELCGPGPAPRLVPGRTDAIELYRIATPGRLLTLRTVVAVFDVLHFEIHRPKALLTPELLSTVATAVRRAAGADHTTRATSFRIEAAGADSAVFVAVGEAIAEATGLAYAPEDGRVVIRVRRTPEADRTDPAAGWDVLVRQGTRPMSARAWRAADYPGALNATIAAAAVRLGGVRPDQRVLNVMCGSGTLMVERLDAGPVADALAVDISPRAAAAARANLDAAGHHAVRVEAADGLDPTATGTGWDVVLVDPPWSDAHGSHATAEDVHTRLLATAHTITAPGATLVVVTHEVKVMQRVVDAAAAQWRPRAEPLRVFAKGHHPRIWVLDRTS